MMAESFRAKLITAARNGEGFDTETGLPDSMMRKLGDVTFFDHAMEFTASAWPSVAAKSRGSIVETLSRVVPVAVRNLPAAPDADLLRAALRKELNQGDHAGALTEDEARAIAWLKRASRPVRAFEDASIELAEFALRRASLDEVFLALTGHRAEEETAEEDGKGEQAASARELDRSTR